MNKRFFYALGVVISITIGMIGLFVLTSGVLSYKEAKGLILYGTSNELKESMKIAKNNLDYSYQTEIKIIQNELLIIKEKDMQKLCQYGLINRVKNDDNVEQVTSIPSAAGRPVLFSDKDHVSISLDGKEQEVTSRDNCMIGKSRMFRKGYLIVSENQFAKIAGDEMGMLLLKLDKAADKEIAKYKVRKIQLVDL